MPYYMRTANDANSTDAYLPKTTLEKAGCVGTGAVVPVDPAQAKPETLIFASVITPGNEKVPYPVATPGGGAYLTTPAAVETTATLSVPNL